MRPETIDEQSQQAAPLRLSPPSKAVLFRRRPKTLLVLGTVLIAGFLAAYVSYSRQGEPASLPSALVKSGNIEKTVIAVGSIKAKEYVDVGAQVSGRIEKIHVKIGQRVTKNDLIAKIDPQVYESAVRQSEANLANLSALLRQQQAQAELAAGEFARVAGMLRARAVSSQTVDQAESAARVADATVDATKAQIQAAEAVLQRDKVNLGYTDLYAPMSGTVVAQSALEGQTINAALSTPVILTIADLDIMTVWAQVTESDVTKIKPGMVAYFSTLGMPDQRWRGSVRQLQPTPATENSVVLYNVLIDADNSELLLLPSMTVQVSFLLDEAKGVPVIPLDALHTARLDKERISQVTVMTAGGPAVRSVKVGLTDRESAQISSGLAVGERVLLQKKEQRKDNLLVPLQ